MPADFDPYVQWLGIRNPERPPNHYRLLGIELYESDEDVIRTAADRQMTYLRTFANGPQSALSQRLLNEVSTARLCLLDKTRRDVYEESLRRRDLARAAADSPSIKVDPVPGLLKPPGRGPRAGKPWWQLAIIAVAPIAVVLLLLFGYRWWRDRPVTVANSDPGAPAAKDLRARDSGKADPGAADPGAADREDAAGQAARESTSSAPAETPGVPSSEGVADGGAGKADPGNTLERDPTLSDATASGTGAPEPGSDARSDSAAETATGARGAIDAAVPIQSDGSAAARFSTNLPLGTFLVALAQRDLTAARSTLQSLQTLRRSSGTNVSARELAEAELLLDAHRQFWDAVQAAQKTATVGEQLTISGQAVTVNKRGTTYLQVAEPSGESKVYYTKTSEITPEAAIALAERHFADSLPVAWRLAAAFLAVDRSGDVAAAGQYVARAEQHGVSSAFLIRSVRRLSGESPLEIDVATAAPPTATPPSDAVTTESSATAPAFVASGTEAASGRVTGETSSPPPSLETSSSLPSSEAQRDAQRTVLAPLLSDLKSRLPAERWPAEILKRAEDDSLDASARYVLLKSALQRAVAAQDLDVSLLAAERMHRSFGIDLTQLRHKTLQSLARRVPAAKRSHYAGIALEFARGAVVEDNYAAAVQFAVLAQSIGKSATDRFFRAHVNLVRQEFEQLQQGYESLDNIRQRVASGDPEATEAWGRFVLLQKGDFAKGPADFEMTSDPALSELVRLERLRPTVVDEQLALGSAWFNYAQILTSLEQRNAYRRAQWWLEAGLAAADRDQKLQTRQQLDQIDGLLGRSSETLDLTRLPVVSATVGFGSLGVNRNDDRTDRLVRPVPEIEGKPIEKYLWACAPSAIEYLIPGDAIRFSATGYVNAPTQDGVQFVVETEGREVFTSDVVKRMGVPVPIQVSLPKGTHWLRLKVVAGNTNTNDHAYWIAPQLEF